MSVCNASKTCSIMQARRDASRQRLGHCVECTAIKRTSVHGYLQAARQAYLPVGLELQRKSKLTLGVTDRIVRRQ